MDGLPGTLVTLGALMLLGLATDAVGRRTHLPRVTLLLVLGILIGPIALDLVSTRAEEWLPLVSDVALVMVGFLLGKGMTVRHMRRHGREILWVSIVTVVGTACCVLVGLLLIGASTSVAILLAAISCATAPTATADVIHEARAEGPFTETLLGVVAVDDAWGLILFSGALAVAGTLAGDGGALTALLIGGRELGGALLLGMGLGLPAAFLLGHLRKGEPTLAGALGCVLLGGGLALWLEVSFLLAAMVMGAVVANFAEHHERPFRAIEHVEWPFLILFFVLAGASLHVEAITSIGLVGGGYVVLRIVGRVVGGAVGAKLGNSPPGHGRWLGAALLPHAGVALGMALIAQQHFADTGGIVLSVVIAATVIFEIVGPVLTRRALDAVGESRPSAAD